MAILRRRWATRTAFNLAAVGRANTITSPTRILYTPQTNGDTPTLAGTSSEYVNCGLRFTRSSLRGRDFGGPEVPWVP